MLRCIGARNLAKDTMLNSRGRPGRPEAIWPPALSGQPENTTARDDTVNCVVFCAKIIRMLHKTNYKIARKTTAAIK